MVPFDKLWKSDKFSPWKIRKYKLGPWAKLFVLSQKSTSYNNPIQNLVLGLIQNTTQAQTNQPISPFIKINGG